LVFPGLLPGVWFNFHRVTALLDILSDCPSFCFRKKNVRKAMPERWRKLQIGFLTIIAKCKMQMASFD
jgi:hypothetical protein